MVWYILFRFGMVWDSLDSVWFGIVWGGLVWPKDKGQSGQNLKTTKNDKL